MVSNIEDLTGIESLFLGKGDQQISHQILEMLGNLILYFRSKLFLRDFCDYINHDTL